MIGSKVAARISPGSEPFFGGFRSSCRAVPIVCEPADWKRISPGCRPAQSEAVYGPPEAADYGQVVVRASTLELGVRPFALQVVGEPRFESRIERGDVGGLVLAAGSDR